MNERRMFHSGRISGSSRRPARPAPPRRWQTIQGRRLMVLEHTPDASRYLMSHERKWFYIEVDRKPIVRQRGGGGFPFGPPPSIEVEFGMPLLQVPISRETARSIWNAQNPRVDPMGFDSVQRILKDMFGPHIHTLWSEMEGSEMEDEE